MQETIHFLGWQQHPITNLCDWLLGPFTDGHLVNLANVNIVLPSSTAVRQLQQQLVLATNKTNSPLLAPNIITAGSLPELCYSTKPEASESLQQLVWIQALLKTNKQKQLKAFLPKPPRPDNHSAWLPIAKVVGALHQELSGEGIRFNDLVAYFKRENQPHEQARWQALHEVQNNYLAILDQLDLWDLQTARLVALEKHELTLDENSSFIIAGCTDLSIVHRQFLTQITPAPTILVFAPESHSDHFDKVGCLIADQWTKPLLDTSLTEHLHIASSGDHQADLIADIISNYPSQVSVADIFIAVPGGNPKQIERNLNNFGLQVNAPAGRKLSDTPALVLLSLIASHISNATFESLASLVRYPHLLHRLDSTLSSMTVIDQLVQFQQRHLPYGELQRLPGGKYYRQLEAAMSAVDQWLAAFSSDDHSAITHHENLITAIDTAMGDQLLNRETDSEMIAALSTINRQSTELADAFIALGIDCSAQQFLEQLVTSLASAIAPTSRRPSSVSLGGWLDTPWTPQSHVILTDVNEGIIPSSSDSELFLTDEIRNHLGLLTNQRRFARDAYSLSLMSHHREISLITNRINAEGNPQSISRLLLNGTLTERAQLIYDYSKGNTTQTGHQHPTSFPMAPFDPLRITTSAHEQESYSVTSLRSYLYCPLRYYLSHVLRLGSLDDTAQELDPLAYGNFIHNVLFEFGKSDVANSTVEEEIVLFLRDTSLNLYRRKYGAGTYPAVRLQFEQIQRRLDRFAAWQTSWRATGWEIKEVEYAPEDAALILETAPDCKIHGRIDRIDYHSATDTYAVFDYKTSEKAESPKKTHNINQVPYWKDLQLPMYRHLCRSITGDSAVTLGYINIGNDLDAIGENMAEWNETELKDADQLAVHIIQQIQKGEFEITDDEPKIDFDDYADLLGRTALDSPGFTRLKETNK